MTAGKNLVCQAAVRVLQSLKVVLCGLLVSGLASCETEDYDTGDGSLSSTRAEFVVAYTDGVGAFVSAMTDDGDSLHFSKLLTVKWAEKADSCYRALLYYNKVENTIEPVTATSVVVPAVMSHDNPKAKYRDPLRFESAWLSRNRRYLNFGLYVMAGQVEGDHKQMLGVTRDTVVCHDNGTATYRLHLSHNQNDMPEYYSVQAYMSIPLGTKMLPLKQGDSIVVTIDTYDGAIVRNFAY